MCLFVCVCVCVWCLGWVDGFVKMICLWCVGADLVELWRRYLCDVWGRVCGIVKVICVWCMGDSLWNCDDDVCYLLWTSKLLSTFRALLYISARTVAPAILFMKRQSITCLQKAVGFKKSRIFPSGIHYKQLMIRRDFPVKIFLHNFGKMCVCVCVCVTGYTALQTCG